MIKDLVVDRGAFDRIIAGGRLHHRRPPAARRTRNAIPVAEGGRRRGDGRGGVHRLRRVRRGLPERARRRCSPRAKISHLGLLPQGQPERYRRALTMVAQMDLEGFGGCTLFGECQEACPKEISIDSITRMNRDFLVASMTARDESSGGERRRLTGGTHGDGRAGWTERHGPLAARPPVTTSRTHRDDEPAMPDARPRRPVPASARRGARWRRCRGEDDLRAGSGTEPERIGAMAGRQGSRTGPNATSAILIFLAVGAVLVYLIGWGR